jgi:uncharacterized protein YhbP (UPF0306 family)
LDERVLKYLQAHHVVTLATLGDAKPWAAAVFYVNERFTLYWLSAPTSRHSFELARNPQVAATIQEDCSDWSRIKGVQMEGLAAEISGDEVKWVRALYEDKYPLIGNLSRAPASIVAALAKVSWYKLVPERLWFIDNSVAFGHREQLDLGMSNPLHQPA